MRTDRGVINAPQPGWSDRTLIFWTLTNILPLLEKENRAAVPVLLAAASFDEISEIEAATLLRSKAAKMAIKIDWPSARIHFLDTRVRQALAQTLYSPESTHGHFHSSPCLKEDRNTKPVCIKKAR